MKKGFNSGVLAVSAIISVSLQADSSAGFNVSSHFSEQGLTLTNFSEEFGMRVMLAGPTGSLHTDLPGGAGSIQLNATSNAMPDGDYRFEILPLIRSEDAQANAMDRQWNLAPREVQTEEVVSGTFYVRDGRIFEGTNQQ